MVRHVTELQLPITVALLFLSSDCKDLGSDPPHSENLTLSDVRFKESTSEHSSIVESGLLVLPLTLDGSMVYPVRWRIRAGVYSDLRFALHKPKDNERNGEPD
jgi:hypothetical protein